ncbi:hypothetical protein QJS04_geneDACA014320 [Acorus gramineus]|uniref:DJ-1/PfpI domain-containing protein n=2 Tax=Acorus gramineus TaxID=55184 RepID=A0AAV8ZYA5_ACOGR|nr:hypothetical protein QJS04_geneDACA014320 [Acorus gramineus]
MEAVITIDVLRRSGADVTVASGLQVDASWGLRLVADVLVSDCVGSAFDLVSLSAGVPGSANLRDCEALEGLVRELFPLKIFVKYLSLSLFASSVSTMASDAPRKVLVPIADGTEPMEAVITIDVLRRSGADVTVASGLQVDASWGLRLVADVLVSDCVGSAFDLVSLSAGVPGSANLRDCEALEGLVREIASVTFLIAFTANYFVGKRNNEAIALAWASRFAIKGSIFEKNFSLLGTGDGKDTPLLLKEGQDVFKFYASGRRYCQGLLATMELRTRHDLISSVYTAIVPGGWMDTISFEVWMNDDAMDHVILAVARKKTARVVQKECQDLQRYANAVSGPPSWVKRWVAEDLVVVAESREVAGDLLSDAVLDQILTDGRATTRLSVSGTIQPSREVLYALGRIPTSPGAPWMNIDHV